MTKQTYSFGWRQDKRDARDMLFKHVFRVKKINKHSDLSGECSPVEDQGDLGSCVFNALVNLGEFLLLRYSSELVDLSRLFSYWNYRKLYADVDEDTGATIRESIKVAVKYGLCRESLCPYDISKFREKPSDKSYTDGKKHLVTSYHRLVTLDDIRACLSMGLPFSFGFDVYDSIYKDEVTKTGKVPMPTKKNYVVGGHGVSAVGHDDDTQLIKFKNSWGESWGDHGYGYLPYAYFERKYATDNWVIQTMESYEYCKACGLWMEKGAMQEAVA